MRRKLRRLENAARGHLASFELEDGSRFCYERGTGELFLHLCDCLRHHQEPQRPEPPELDKALARAKDRRAAFSEVFGPYRDILPYDEQSLIERGEIVPISLVVGRELGEPLPDLSE